MEVNQLWQQAQNRINAQDFVQALVLLNKALKIEPNNANLLSERAVVYFHQGKKKLALKELDHCVLLDPTNPYRYSSRAYIKSSLNDLDGAIADYEKCVELDSEDAIAYNNLGLLLETKGRLDLAKKHFNRADELEGVLKERGIDLSTDSKEVDSTESRSELSDKSNEENTSTWKVVKSVFTDKKVFSEYIKFMKAGLKLKNGDHKKDA